jgi:hypothetical protein
VTPRRPTPPQVKATLPPERALLLLKKQLEVLQGLKNKHHQAGAQEILEWRHFTQSIVERTFGNPSSNLTKFEEACEAGQFWASSMSDADFQEQYLAEISSFEAVVKSYISELGILLVQPEVKGAYASGEEYGKARKRNKRTEGSGAGKVSAIVKGLLAVLGTIIAALGLLAGYKYNGAEDLRNTLYRPLYSELSQVESTLQQDVMLAQFATNTKNTLEQSGEWNRLPKELRDSLSSVYAKASAAQGDLAFLEMLQRSISDRVKHIRTQEQDAAWTQNALAVLNAELRAKPGESGVRAFTMKHVGHSPALDARNPSDPRYAQPGASCERASTIDLFFPPVSVVFVDAGPPCVGVLAPEDNKPPDIRGKPDAVMAVRFVNGFCLENAM